MSALALSDAERERLRYERVWWEQGYRAHSPAVRAIQQLNLLEFFAANGVKTILDAGCGTGQALALFNAGGRFDAQGFDIAVNALNAGVTAKFTQGCLWHAAEVPKDNDAVFCCDVMEHIPPQHVPATLRNLRLATKRVAFFTICTVLDVWGPRLFKSPLHLTVQPAAWWAERFRQAGFVPHADNAASASKAGPSYAFAMLTPAVPVTVSERAGCPVTADARVVLVGNGPAVLGKKLGAHIDGFDEVVRFNCYQLEGFEEDVGAKTTLWATFGHGTVPRTSEPPTRILFIHGANGFPARGGDVWRVPLTFYQSLRAKIQSLSTREGERLARTAPSSGCLACNWLLECGVKQVHLAGFNHFAKIESKLHHYWLPKAFGKPVEHDGDAEALLFAVFRKQGRVVYLG